MHQFSPWKKCVGTALAINMEKRKGGQKINEKTMDIDHIHRAAAYCSWCLRAAGRVCV
jgi:hypothetical protein